MPRPLPISTYSLLLLVHTSKYHKPRNTRQRRDGSDRIASTTSKVTRAVPAIGDTCTLSTQCPYDIRACPLAVRRVTACTSKPLLVFALAIRRSFGLSPSLPTIFRVDSAASCPSLSSSSPDHVWTCEEVVSMRPPPLAQEMHHRCSVFQLSRSSLETRPGMT